MAACAVENVVCDVLVVSRMYKLANRLSESQKQLAIFAAIYIGTAILLVHLFPLLARLNSGNCDPWYYFGPMLTADLFPPQGRVALTFPTYIFGKLFGIDYLETFYFVSTISVIAVSTFAALRMLFDPISAAFASAITGLSGYVLNVSSTTYSSPGLAYGCIAFWLLCKSLYSGHLTGTYLPLFFSGFALSWAFNVHPVAFAVLAPLYIVALGAKKAPAAVVWRLDAAIIVAILGFIVGTLAIGLIGYLLYGRFFDSCFRQFMEIYGTFHGGVHYNLNRWLVGDWWHEDSIFQILIFYWRHPYSSRCDQCRVHTTPKSYAQLVLVCRVRYSLY
jgi:hypothetical protein